MSLFFACHMIDSVSRFPTRALNSSHIRLSVKLLKMANVIGDSDEERYVDRIRALAWKEARDAGAQFITQKWVSDKLNRSIEWVRRNWKRSYADSKRKTGAGRPESLSQGSKDVIIGSSHKRKKGCREMVKEILEKRGRVVSHETVRLFRHSEGQKAWHCIKKPKKTSQNIEDRLWFCEFLRE